MASHTATGEWKSFELRMRKRRAERLLLRAGTAAEMGRADEARECLEEARRLVPGLAGIAAMQQRLDAPAVVPAAHALAPRLPVLLATGVVLIATAVIGIALRHPPQPLHARDFRTLQLASPAPTVEAATAVMADPARPAPVEPAALETPAPAPPTPVTRDEDVSRPLPVTSIVPDPPAPTAVPVMALDAPEAVPADLPGTTRVTEPVTETADANAAVRGVLDRYAAAYSALDAAAAQRVWPDVDRSALARAFDDLASQHVSLGECRIDVAGVAARATCTGSATWAPKVGDTSPRTERRQWSFELARSTDAWHIVSARAQNR